MRGRKKSEDTRRAILRCAAEVFSERPYHEVPIDEISARLKVGKGTLYRYFTSKEELYFATIVDGLKGMQDAIDETLRQPAPVERIIEALARTMIGYFWQRRDFFVLLYRHEAKLDPSERAEWQKGREELVVTVGQRLAAELGATSIDLRLAVEMLFGMIRAVCIYRDESARVEDLARLVTGVFLGGIQGAGRAARPTAVERRRAAAGKR
jgi:AcrR family transcriptional regulator